MAAVCPPGRRAWTSIAGRRIASVSYTRDGFVRLQLDDGTFIEIYGDDGHDDAGASLVVTDDLEDAT